MSDLRAFVQELVHQMGSRLASGFVLDMEVLASAGIALPDLKTEMNGFAFEMRDYGTRIHIFVPTEEGCRMCANGYRSAGELKCRKEPHAGTTPEQNAIAAWLRTPGRAAFSDSGCPSFEPSQELSEVRRIG